MNFTAIKLIAGYAAASVGAVTAAWVLACALGNHPALQHNFFG